MSDRVLFNKFIHDTSQYHGSDNESIKTHKTNGSNKTTHSKRNDESSTDLLMQNIQQEFKKIDA